MVINFDQNKRNKTLKERGLDFNDALSVFNGECYEFEDIRQDYGEQRIKRKLMRILSHKKNMMNCLN